MWKRLLGSLITVFVLGVYCVPAALSQAQTQPLVYTYVSQFQVPRANWAQYTEDQEKTINPIFERLMGDGTLVGWGTFENIVHTPDGMTHGAWWSSTSLAGILRVLDEIRKAGPPRPGQTAATKHEDLLMRTVYYHAATVSGGGTGYLRVNCTIAQPGKTDDFVATIKKYLGPTQEEEFKKGNSIYYGMDAQYVLTGPGSMRCTVAAFPNAEAMNKWAEAINLRVEKLLAEEKGFQEGLANSTVPNSRRDLLARITHSARK